METVFITIHDLSLDARIRYCSDSVEDILGYLPNEVKGKSCWEYFHPDEIPFAKAVHGRSLHLDKAAALHYCQIKHKDGSWVSCECVFTVVYDVLVASTSIYRRGPQSQQRAFDAPAIRRIFSSSPRDPRYHMLSYLSNKFYQEPSPHAHEPRAALFLNRFTRTSTIMFATSGVANILGVTAAELTGKSFYYCIAESCLSDAIRCLESAKANDSIAYLRFWFRNPLQEEHRVAAASLGDVRSDEEDEDDGGVRIVRPEASPSVAIESSDSSRSGGQDYTSSALLEANSAPGNSRSSSGNTTDSGRDGSGEIFDPPALQRERSSVSSVQDAPFMEADQIEIEAVVSCSSDGLVVVLRRALPLAPDALGSADSVNLEHGLFAAPWALEAFGSEAAIDGGAPSSTGDPGSEPEPTGVMSAIREVACFAWSLTGINGTLAELAHGTPLGESQPPGGLPVWDASSNADPENRYNGFSGSRHRPINLEQMTSYGETEVSEGLETGTSNGSKDGSKMDKTSEESSSEDEVVWKRAPTMPEWRRPPRRGHSEAFGSEDGTHEADIKPSDSRRRRLDDS